MESDLPLMELAEEDDSFIQPFPDPNQTPSKSSFNFTCSPLAVPPSRTKSLKDSVHTEKPSSSSTEASNNKENINSNNVEMPKLGMGPIQMKRRKKGAEYNLRKSLAWDRAFFTDEGILDPRELNMITGINAYTCGRGLPTISEEGNSSFSSGSRCRNEPNYMEASKKALLKELYDKSRTSKGTKLGNHDSLPHHKVTHKVLSSDHSNRAGSKVNGCSEPSSASSLKRPNLNALRTAKKESKIPKLPMSKSGSCFSAMTKGSMTARHNLIPKPPINVQKNVGLKSSLKDVHGSQSKAKTGPDKELAQKTVRNLTNSCSKATSSTKSQLVHVEKANSGLEMVPDRLQSCETEDKSTPLAAKSPAQLTPTTSNNSLPSGLRLPSPSLRFFDQTTASESVSLQQKRIQQFNTNTCSNRQNGDLRTPSTPRTPSGRCSISNSLSPSSNYMENKAVQNSNVNSDIVRKMPYECRGFDAESHKVIEIEKRILEHEGKMGMEKIAVKGDEEVKVSHPTEQSGNETKNEFVLHNEEEKVQIHTATSMSTPGQSIQHQEQNFLTMADGSMNFLQDLAQTSEGWSVNCILPAASSSLEEGPLVIVTKTNDYLFQEKKGSNNSSAKLMEVPGQKEHGVDVGLIHGKQIEELQMEFREVASLFDDCVLRPEVELINGTASVGDDVTFKTESVMQVASIYPQSLEEQGLDIEAEPATIEAEFKIEVENQKHQEMGIIIGNLSDRSDVYEYDAKQSNPIVLEQSISHGCELQNSNGAAQILPMLQGNVSDINGDDRPHEPQDLVGVMTSMEMYGFEKNKDATVLMKRSDNIKRQDKSLVINAVPFSDEWLAAIEAAGEDLAETSREQANTQKPVGDDAIFNAESVMQVAQCASTYPHSLEEQGLDIAPATIKAEFKIKEQKQNHQEMGIIIGNLSDPSDVYIYDAKPPNPIILEQNVSTHILLMVQDDQPNEPQDFLGVMPSMETNNYFTPSSSVKATSTTGVTEGSKRLGEEVEDEVLQQGKSPMVGDGGSDVKKNKDATVLMKRSNNINRQDKSLAVIEALGEDLAQTSSEKSDASKINRVSLLDAGSLVSEVFVESQRDKIGKREDYLSDFNGENQLKEPQDSVGVMSSMEANNYFTNGESGYALESSESNSSFSASTSVKATSTSTMLCSVIPESCSVSGGNEEELEAEVLQQGKNKDATVSIKKSNNINRQDKSLVINAVPFSDEWLAAIEAAGEEILTMKRGAVQHSPPHKSIPEPNPWSPVKSKANQIGPYDCTKYTNAGPSNPH